MKIEVHERGTVKNSIDLELPGGFSEKDHLLRKLIIEDHVAEIRRIYPYAEIQLAFESRIHLIKE